MIGDKSIIDIGFVSSKAELNSFCNISNIDKKIEHQPLHATEGSESLPDNAFPQPEYFIVVLENAAQCSHSIKCERRLLEDISNLNVCLRCASSKCRWLLTFKQKKGFLKIEVFTRAIFSSDFQTGMHNHIVQIARTLISKKEASSCRDLFKSILKVGLSPPKVWKASMFSRTKISGMIPIVKIPFYSKRRSLDLLLLLFEKNHDIARSCLMDCMSHWVNDFEIATWELVWDSTIIKMRTNNLFYRLSFSFRNHVNQDRLGETSRDVLCSYLLAHLEIYNHILQLDVKLSDNVSEKIERCLSKLQTLSYKFLHEQMSKMEIDLPVKCKV